MRSTAAPSLLSNEILVPAGTGRNLTHFRMVWPHRPETVTGDALHTGADPDKAPAAANVNIVGGDPGEGVPFEAPIPIRAAQRGAATAWFPSPAAACRTATLDHATVIGY